MGCASGLRVAAARFRAPGGLPRASALARCAERFRAPPLVPSDSGLPRSSARVSLARSATGERAPALPAKNRAINIAAARFVTNFALTAIKRTLLRQSARFVQKLAASEWI